jgi:hypothetical protein
MKKLPLYLLTGSFLLNLFFMLYVIPTVDHIITVQDMNIDQILNDFERLCRQEKSSH